jgi:WD40 repeat protein
MSAAPSDRSLLFGVLALQMDFIDRDALIAALHAGVPDKAMPLGQLLVEQGALLPSKRDLLEALLQVHLEIHGHDVGKSLAALCQPHPLPQDVHHLGANVVQASLAQLPGSTGNHAAPGCVDGPGAAPEAETFPPPPASLPDGHEAATLPPDGPGRAPSPPDGIVIPGYEILGVLGRGGMGVVYKARQVNADRLVALKMILAGGHAGAQDLDRFRAEAQAVARLQHTNIVQIFEVGEQRGLPFFSLEYVEGGSLAEKLDGTPWPAAPAAKLVATLAAAMEYAHEKGILHRDLKPGNVLLTADGQPKITDFGLAKRLDAGTGQTQSGAILGTPSYMAPEQADCTRHAVGKPADVYALGAILYELLTGRPPFRAATPLDTVLQVVGEEPVPPSRLQSKVARDLETICLKCLRKEPGKRYPTAAALAEDLRRFQAQEPILARPVGAGERAVKWVKRRPALAALLVVSVLALAAVLGGGTAFTLRLQEQIRETEKARDNARSNQYVAQLNLVRREYEANKIGRVWELLEAQVPQEPGTADYRGFEWYYWHRMSHRELLTLQGKGSTSVAYSPDGRRLAMTVWDSTVRVKDAASGQELLTLTGHTGPISGMAFSPDGTRLASSSFDKTVRVWDAATGQELLTLTGHTDIVKSLAFSPDGRQLASAGGDQTIRVWDAASGQELLALQGHTGHVQGVAFSPDGRRLTSAGADKTVRIWDARSGQAQRTLKGHTGPVSAVAFDPDGRKLVSAGNDEAIRVWDAASGQELLSVKGHTGPVSGVVYSPDGRQLASAGWDHTVRVWDSTSGRKLRTFLGHTGEVIAVAFRADGRTLASSSQDGTVRVWGTAGGLEFHSLVGHTGTVWGVAFRPPDGQRLASAGEDGTVRLWDADSGQQLLSLRGHKGPVHSVAYSPDGRQLASAGSDGTVRVWAADSGQELLTLQGHTNWVYGVAFSPDGRQLASAGSDRTVRVWDAVSGQELLTLQGFASVVRGVAYSPDGRRLGTAGPFRDEMVRVWEAASGRQVLILQGHKQGETGATYSPEGQRLLSPSPFGEARVQLRGIPTRQGMLSLTRQMGRAWGLAYSPDGRRLAAVGLGQMVRVWDAASGQEQLAITGHSSWVWGLAYSPDSQRLATASNDRTVRLWDAATGQELLTLNGHLGSVWSLAFSPDGERLASAGDDQVVLWESRPVSAEVWRQRGLVSDVQSRFDKLLLREEVVAALRKDSKLSEADREFALQVAQTHDENARALNEAAWKVVKARDAGREACALALRHAEAASRAAPDDGLILNTLGVAQYRAGRYADALAALTKSEKLNATREGSNPSDVAFLAMAQHHLDQKDPSQATLDRLRKIMKQPRWEKDAESVSFLREAEELIEGKTAGRSQ